MKLSVDRPTTQKLADDLIKTYIEWRDACDRVDAAYPSWGSEIACGDAVACSPVAFSIRHQAVRHHRRKSTQRWLGIGDYTSPTKSSRLITSAWWGKTCSMRTRCTSGCGSAQQSLNTYS
jgi:hypothetical protein